MTQRYATLVADYLKTDTQLAQIATGGILDRDPRSSGSNATTAIFEVDSYSEILPTVAVAPSSRASAPYGPPGSYEGYLVIRLFVPDYPAMYVTLDTMARRIIKLLNGYRHSTEHPAQFRWFSQMGMTRGGLFDDVAYDELRFQYVGMHEEA